MCLCLEPVKIGRNIINAANNTLCTFRFAWASPYGLSKYLPGSVFRQLLYTRSGIEHTFDQGS